MYVHFRGKEGRDLSRLSAHEGVIIGVELVRPLDKVFDGKESTRLGHPVYSHVPNKGGAYKVTVDLDGRFDFGGGNLSPEKTKEFARAFTGDSIDGMRGLKVCLLFDGAFPVAIGRGTLRALV